MSRFSRDPQTDLERVGGHPVTGVHGSDGNDPAMDPVVPLDPGPEADERRKALPGAVLLHKLRLGDPVRLSDHRNLLPGDLAKDTDGKARAGKGIRC